jgi:hypothetical protein
MVPGLIIVAALFLALLALNVSTILAARAVKRDVTRRFDEMQRRLEKRANSIVDHIFDA